MKKLAVVFATVFALVGGSVAFTSTPALANCDPDVPTVQISGGSVSNSTTIDLNADAGTGIADSSGGDDNIALTLGGDLGDTAASGNAGTADAAANGGAIAVGDVNSGGNIGNTIEVGDTSCAPAPEKPAPEKKPAAPEKKDQGGKKAPVAALPDTGTGVAGDVNFGFIALALVGAVAAAGYSVRARLS